MTTYKVTLADGQRFWIDADLVQAAAPISVCFHDPREPDEWQNTPYQTADARHDEMRAAELIAEHFCDGPDDCTEISSVEVEIVCSER